MKPVTPLLAVNCVIFDEEMSVLLIRRKPSPRTRRREDPYAGMFALPGGFVEVGETLEAACKREVLEETNLMVYGLQLVNIYSNPSRDYRDHTVSIAFCGYIVGGFPVPEDDATILTFDWRDMQLAFDHKQIIDDAARLRSTLARHCAGM